MTLEEYWISYFDSLQTVNAPNMDVEGWNSHVFTDTWETYVSDYHEYQERKHRVYDYHPVNEPTFDGTEGFNRIKYAPGRTRTFADPKLTPREQAGYFIYGGEIDPNKYITLMHERTGRGLLSSMYHRAQVLDLKGAGFGSDEMKQGMLGLYRSDLVDYVPNYVTQNFNIQLPISDELFDDIRVSDYKLVDVMPFSATKLRVERPIKYMENTDRVIYLHKGTTLYKVRFVNGVEQLVVRKPELSLLLLNVGK